MLTKTQPDEMQDFLVDASYIRGGHAERVVFPESAAEVAALLLEASTTKTQVTISGAGTGTVGGRVPFGGIVLATDRLNQIKGIVHENHGGRATAQSGVRLIDFQRAVAAQKLFYPPDPTEANCFLGGTIATNASGARTFKYGATRNYVERLQIVLATGDVIEIHRGELRAAVGGQVRIPCSSGRVIAAQLPSYRMPATRKHAAAYYVAPEMDVIDLFIGSEGTLGVIVEAEVRLLRQPEGLLSGVVFFESEDKLHAFVREARERSLQFRLGQRDELPLAAATLDARALEFFDRESLKFLREKYQDIPGGAAGAIFFEQETTGRDEEILMDSWLQLMARHEALGDESWFATNEQDQANLREFRHQLPVLMNAWFARYNQQKVSTDMAVPDEEFPAMLGFYQEALRGGELKYTIFGHIGDNHVHVNVLPRDGNEAKLAREIYMKFIRRAVQLGGTISAEHGIGKLKREYLRELYGEKHLVEMAALKRAFDPAGILGRGNIFADSYVK